MIEEKARIIMGFTLFIIVILLLFYERIKTLKNEHFEELLEALDNQEKELKIKQEELENDFLQKLRMLECKHDNILTNYENKIPIMSFAVESSENVRMRMRDTSPVKSTDKLYRNDGYVFSFSDAKALSHGQVFKLLQTEVAKWLIDNAMVIGKFNREKRQVDFTLRYLNFTA